MIELPHRSAQVAPGVRQKQPNTRNPHPLARGDCSHPLLPPLGTHHCHAQVCRTLFNALERAAPCGSPPAAQAQHHQVGNFGIGWMGYMDKITKFRDLAMSGLTEGEDWICWSGEDWTLRTPGDSSPSNISLCSAWNSLKVNMLCRMSPIRNLNVLCKHQPNLITEPGQKICIHLTDGSEWGQRLNHLPEDMMVQPGGVKGSIKS